VRLCKEQINISCSSVSICNLLSQAFTSTGVKRGEGFSGDVNTSFVNKNITADVKVDTKSNVSLLPLQLARNTILHCPVEAYVMDVCSAST